MHLHRGGLCISRCVCRREPRMVKTGFDHRIGHLWLLSIELVIIMPYDALSCDALQTAWPSSILRLQAAHPIRHAHSTMRQLFEDDRDDGVCPRLVACELNGPYDFLLL